MLGDGVSHFTPGTSVRTGSDTRYQHYGLKNIDAQSSSSQTISATRSYDAFGQTLGSSGSWSGPFGYGGAFGYQSEPDSGLQLLGHRYYDPSAGRFLSRDKARDGGNWYAYCGNSPLTHADPTGQIPLAVPLVMLGIAAWRAWCTYDFMTSIDEFIDDPSIQNGLFLLLACVGGRAGGRNFPPLPSQDRVACIGRRYPPSPETPTRCMYPRPHYTAGMGANLVAPWQLPAILRLGAV